MPLLALAWRDSEVCLALMPPVVRGGHLLSISLLLLLWLGRETERGTIFLGPGLAISLGISAGMLLVWLRQPDDVFFNFSNLDYIWGAICLLLLAAAGLTVLLRRQKNWLLIGLHFGRRCLGQGVNWSLALPGAHLPIAAMLPMLVAVPLLLYLPLHPTEDTQPQKAARSDLEAQAGYITSFDDGEYGDEPSEARNEAPDEEYEDFDDDFEALEASFDTPGDSPPIDPDADPETTQWPDCEEQAERLGREFGADAVALIQVNVESLTAELICGYNLREDQVILPAFLELSQMPRLASALQRERALRLAGRTRHEDIAVLVDELELNFGDYLLAGKLPDGPEAVNVFALLLRDDQAWTLEDEENLERGTALSEEDQQEWGEFSRALDSAEPLPEPIPKTPSDPGPPPAADLAHLQQAADEKAQ